jgi:tetratricopeptide (TPR) repeat protein
MSRLVRSFLVFVLPLCSLGLCGRSSALDPEPDKPYQLRVVLGVADQRLLTDVFKEQVERELRDGLQAALGDLATVEVVRTHPRLKEVEANGLEKALDAWKDVDGVKTHFVMIDYVNGQYEIQARQHDGYTGQSSPVVRTDHTLDRQFVARTAALLVGKDFGLVGTVTGVDGQTARVTLKGSGLGVALDRWIKKDDVFALVQISPGSGGGYRAVRVPWAVLQVQKDPEEGVCACQVYNRHPNPLAQGAGVLGYRCLKLNTIQAPLRLRVVEANDKKTIPKGGLQIHVRRHGFTGEDESKVQGVTDPDGFFSTEKDKDRGVFDHLAFASIVDGDKLLVPKIPVPLVDERPVVVPVNIKVDASAQLTVRRDLWVGQVYESLLVMVDLFKDLEKLLKDKKHAEAMNRAQAAAKGLPDDLARFRQQRQMLVDDARGAKLDLTEGDERLKELVTAQGKLHDLIGRLQAVLDKANDPKLKELQAKLSQAQLLENDAEFGKALDLYEQILKEDPDNVDLKKRYKKLKEDWSLKGDKEKHRRARDYIYDTWPNVDALKLKAELPRAREAFETCRDVGDFLTPQKLRKAVLVHAGHLKEQLAALMPDVNEDDRKAAKDIQEISEGLQVLVKEVNSYLDRVAPEK